MDDMDDMDDMIVILEVRSGVAFPLFIPDGVKLQIRDYDGVEMADEDTALKQDEEGDSYVLVEYDET